jgi:hypothetical protein
VLAWYEHQRSYPWCVPASAVGLAAAREECHDRNGWWCSGWEVWCAGIWPGFGAGRDSREAMLMALLIALSVDLVVVVAFAAFVPGRRRWLRGQPGEFAGAIRVSSGGVGPRAQVTGPLAADVT